MLRSLLQSFLAVITLGMVQLGCNKAEAAVTPTDVTLYVPAMN
jgi:hypothetical protein